MFGPKPMFLSPGNEFKALIWTSEVCSRLYKPCTRSATPISTPLTRCAHGSIMFVSIICNTGVTVWSHTYREVYVFVQKKSTQSVYLGLRCTLNPLKLHYIQLYKWPYHSKNMSISEHAISLLVDYSNSPNTKCHIPFSTTLQFHLQPSFPHPNVSCSLVIYAVLWYKSYRFYLYLRYSTPQTNLWSGLSVSYTQWESDSSRPTLSTFLSLSNPSF